MAVGTGNLWRFPRVAAENGGAAFLIPWLLFLFLWSLPLLIAEFGLGRGSRRGVIGAFADLVGRRWAWMGGFVAVTSVMILFYYSVVTGWTLKYFAVTLLGSLQGAAAEEYWTTFSASVWQPLAFQIAAVLMAAAIISRGVVAGIERANRVLIPTLFVLLVVAVVRSVTLPGAGRGLGFLFNPDLSLLGSYRTWLEALTQSAWSTGAGWGLILTYAVYVKREEDVVLNSTAIGFGNNTASLLAGMAIVPTAFAILSENEALAVMASGNQGLTFIWIPQLFDRIPAGGLFLPLFFLALFCAALSSLIAMFELATRILMDTGMPRPRAIRWVTAAVNRRGGAVGGQPQRLRQPGLGVGPRPHDQRPVHRDGGAALRSRAVPARAGRRVGGPPPCRARLGMGGDVAGAYRVPGDVHLVDVPGGGGVRSGRLVEPGAGQLARNVPAPVGHRAGPAARVQPPHRRGQPAGRRVTACRPADTAASCANLNGWNALKGASACTQNS